MYVYKYMNPDIISIKNDDPLYKAQKKMRECHIHHLPVVNHKGELTGMLTDSKLREVVAVLASSLAPDEFQEKLKYAKVEDFMAKRLMTVSQGATLAEAGAIGVRHRVGALPVMDDNGKMVGIITTTDLINALRQIFGFGEKSFLIDFSDTIKQDDLAGLINIMQQRKAVIRSLFCIYPPRVKKENWIMCIDTDDINAINDDMKSKGFACTIKSHKL